MIYQQMNLFGEQEEKKSRSFREASLVSLIALVENVRRLMTSAICGVSITESFARLTPDGLWQKMYGDCYQVSMDGSSEEFLGTWTDGGGCIWWYCFPAAAAGSAFVGDRVSIVAASTGVRDGSMGEMPEIRPDAKYLENVEQWTSRQNRILSHMGRPNTLPERRHVRNDDGLSEQMDRIKCLGNSVVPYQFYPIFKAIADIESEWGFKGEEKYGAINRKR